MIENVQDTSQIDSGAAVQCGQKDCHTFFQSNFTFKNENVLDTYTI